MTSTKRKQQLAKWVLLTMGSFLGVLHFTLTPEIEASQGLGGPTHIGTFEGSTTFTTSSSNGINPGLYLEVMDRYGNYTEYTSEDGVITLPDTEEGAYITQAKLLGKTMYRDQDTGELLDTWEEGRNLQLESVKMPVLTTTGKNLFDGELEKGNISSSNGLDTNSDSHMRSKNYINVEPNKVYAFSINTSDVKGLRFYDNNKNFISASVLSSSFTTPSNCKYIRFIVSTSNPDLEIQIEKNFTSTAYEPYKSNILTVNEPVELRGIGDVQDTLDLVTGEVTQRITSKTLRGGDNEDWRLFRNTFLEKTETVDFYLINNEQQSFSNIKSDLFKEQNEKSSYQLDEEGISCKGGSGINIWLSLSKIKATNVTELRTYLQSNPITVQYQLAIESIKTVALSNTYDFPPVTHRELLIEGSVLPLVCSVTTPTEPLSFVLNPNGEKGQQFIAPEFSISNQTPANVSVEVRQFTQLSQVFNDVLPDTHDDWTLLDQEQSKDFALALVPKPSNEWKTLMEGPRYVADSSNFKIGTIKPESRVSFTFLAHHGRSFTTALNPKYRLVMVFDFSS